MNLEQKNQLCKERHQYLNKLFHKVKLGKKKPNQFMIKLVFSRHYVRGGVHPREGQDKQPFMLPLTPRDGLELPINLSVFGLWEETGVPGEKPYLHRESMQMPHRKTRRRTCDLPCATFTLFTPPPIIKLSTSLT